MQIPNNAFEKIKKLLALAAETSGGTESERDNAMARAQELALKHGIEIASINLHQTEVSQGSEKSRTGGKEIRFITRIVQYFFDNSVQAIWNFNKRGPNSDYGHYFGKVEDLPYALFLSDWLQDEFKRRWKSYRETLRNQGHPDAKNPMKFQLRFYSGLCRGVYKILKEAKEKAKQGFSQDQVDKYAIVVANQELIATTAMQKAYPNMVQTKDRVQADQHLSAGYYEGLDVRLPNAPLENGPTQTLRLQ